MDNKEYTCVNCGSKAFSTIKSSDKGEMFFSLFGAGEKVILLGCNKCSNVQFKRTVKDDELQRLLQK